MQAKTFNQTKLTKGKIMNRTNQQQFIRIGAVIIAINTIASVKFRGFGEADVILRNGRGFRIRGITETQQKDTLYTLEKLTNAIKNN